MCLEKALTIHSSLKAKNCPDPFRYLEAETDRKRCSVLCNGTYTIKEPDPHRHCVGFNINFKLEEALITNIKVFPCGILNCSLEVVKFECTLNKTSSNKEDQINQQDIDGENRSCIDCNLSQSFISRITGIVLTYKGRELQRLEVHWRQSMRILRRQLGW